MASRDGFIAVAVEDVFDTIHGKARLDLYRYATPTSAPAMTTIDGDVGTFGHWVSIALDVDHTSWITYTEPNDASSGARVVVVGVDANGAIVEGPIVTIDDTGSAAPRTSVAVSPLGRVGFAIKGASGDVSYGEHPDVPQASVPGLESFFSEDELQRVALAYDSSACAHILAQRGTTVIHAFQAQQSGAFSTEQVDFGDLEGTYASIAVDDDDAIHVAYDIDVGGSPTQCFATRDPSNGQWSGCQLTGADFNTHSDALAILPAGKFGIAYSDATIEAPVLVRGVPGAFATPLQLDFDGVIARFTTIALLPSGQIAVAYSIGDAGGAVGAVRIALVDP